MSRAANSSGKVQVRVRPYLFEAAAAGGKRRLGVRRARDVRHLAEQLRGERMIPLRSWALPSFGGTPEVGRISLKDEAELHTQLSQLLSRGVPLVEALEVCESAVSSSMRSRVTRMREAVAAGSSFADAMNAAGGFDQVTTAVYRAAERTGDMAGAAKQLSTTVRRTLQVRGKAITLLMYPVIVLSIAVLVSVGMITGVVPQIVDSLRGQVTSLPWFTELIYSVGMALRSNALLCLTIVGLAMVGMVVFRARVAAAVGRLMRTLPLMRDVVLAQESARFFTVMSAMTRTGVVLSDALGVAEAAIGHPKLRAELTRLRTRLIEGGVLRVLIDEVATLPLATRRLLIAAERSGDLQQAFDTLAADMADEVETRSSRLLAVLEPMLIFLMFIMIGSLVLSIMIPLLTITSRVQGI